MGLGCGTPTNVKTQKYTKHCYGTSSCQMPQNIISSRCFWGLKFSKNLCMGLGCGTKNLKSVALATGVASYSLKSNQCFGENPCTGLGLEILTNFNTPPPPPQSNRH